MERVPVPYLPVESPLVYGYLFCFVFPYVTSVIGRCWLDILEERGRGKKVVILFAW